MRSPSFRVEQVFRGSHRTDEELIDATKSKLNEASMGLWSQASDCRKAYGITRKREFIILLRAHR